ncbi:MULTISPECIES: BTAD domain-containing putative transcriptional regulator [unclassified Streptomyces]|uniref:AfsR/SARP family transcriptional regulator n=1 Tax=unclassified Streptomyces TaxID=2593676 RepID=UPI002253D0F4|nr:MULTISPECIES: BTAD domain-containing putative transcriptional regulator [unclassified Streptomyces]MCX4526474.1 winged helix-turn-helix domain-containing protein [Streptomyces sp. NBC_01551]MCX4542963.1 winged helix-turn-helix domain-containing protein [Streptomyces sp. NBC_01565]
MRFEVLGPVTVRTDDGTPVPVPEAKVRALLAALLVHHGRPVAVDRLIDDLWGEDAPGNPGNTLQTKVSQLRRTLAGAEDGGRALVGYGPAGYTLRVSGEAVDAARFEELAGRAREESGVRTKSALLTRALGLWRGPAYADVRDAGFARAAVARLEEQRVTVREELAEARLELGEHAALADELNGLAGEHPLRQRLRAAQMRALYGAGRQSEALAVYGEVRTRFAEELGIDPGPELAALYEAILRQDPTAAAPVAPGAPGPGPGAPGAGPGAPGAGPGAPGPGPGAPGPRAGAAGAEPGAPGRRATTPGPEAPGRRATTPEPEAAAPEPWAMTAVPESEAAAPGAEAAGAEPGVPGRRAAAPGPGPGAAAPQAGAAAAGPEASGAGAAGAAAGAGVWVGGGLPASVGGLVGREEDVARVCAAVEAGRLVTLTGPGGVGKTRLALAAAARLADAPACSDGVWFVELAGARGSVAAVVAAALGVREDADGAGGSGARGEDAARERLAEAIGARGLLLVLDNCEHVVEAVATLAGELLRRAPGLRVLATSQEPLALSGEVLEAVAPLPEAEAVRLFAARAAAAAPGFTLSPDNSEAVALICRRLDGIPLALELAATRVRALGVHTLADRLHDRFRLLNQVRRDAPARQRTLRAVIDWSWELLKPDERVALRRLAVFCGGFTLESAEAVCAGGEIGTDEVLDLVTRLVDCSLVATAYGGDGARLRTLESVTAYGLERLAEAGAAEADAVRLRHAEHCTALAERAASHLHGPGQREWLRRLDDESHNLRAALDHAVAAGAGDLALRLVNALAWYWCLRGRIAEARAALDAALACATATGASGAAVAGAHARRAAFAALAGTPDGPGEADLESADARGRWLLEFARLGFADAGAGAGAGEDAGAREDGEAEEGGGAREGGEGPTAGGPTGGGHPGGGDPGEGHPARGHACAGLDRLVAQFRGVGDRWGEAAALNALATRALYRGDLAELRRNAEASAALFAELGDRWGQLQASEQLGVLAELAGDYPTAARLHREGVRSAQELELWTQVSFRLARQGRIALLTGDTTRAAELHERARRLAVEQSHRPAEQFAEIGLALGARRDGDLDAAEARLLPWLEWNRRLGVDSGAALVLAQLGYVAELRGDRGRAEERHREGLAAARRSGDPRALALAFEGLAGALPAGRAAHAATLLGAAAALRKSAGTPLPEAERADVDRATARLRTTLGDAAFTAAFTRGRTRPTEPDA